MTFEGPYEPSLYANINTTNGSRNVVTDDSPMAINPPNNCLTTVGTDVLKTLVCTDKQIKPTICMFFFPFYLFIFYLMLKLIIKRSQGRTLPETDSTVPVRSAVSMYLMSKSHFVQTLRKT